MFRTLLTNITCIRKVQKNYAAHLLFDWNECFKHGFRNFCSTWETYSRMVLILDIISLILTKFPYSLIITVLFILFGYYFPFIGYWSYNSLCRMAFYCGWIEHRRPADQVLYFWPILLTFPSFLGNKWFTVEFCSLSFTVLLFLDSIIDNMFSYQAGLDRFGLKFLCRSSWADLLKKCPFKIEMH